MNILERSRLNQVILFALLILSSFIGGHEKQNNLIYILEWTITYDLHSQAEWPYRYLEMDQESFTSKNCSFQNCFITSNRSYFEDVLDYDVVIFNAVHYSRFPLQNFELPHIRSQIQQYILFSVEPAAYNPIPDYLNGEINFTWTYKLDSDIIHPYFLVKNNFNEIIGPKTDMHWINIEDLPPTNSSIIEKLKNKRLAAVWIASNCDSKNRLSYIKSLQNELKSGYGLQLDIYGRCGDNSACMQSVEGLTKCFAKIERYYYFYMAFENSNSEDYVSEKVLHGLNHFTVPIVYGGANYTRFLPDGIYLNAKHMSVERLAKEMNDIIKDPARYYDFFKWHGYYKFQGTASDAYTYTVCEFCAFLNNEKQKHSSTIRTYQNITGWWNVPSPDDVPHSNSVLVEEQLETTTTVLTKVLDYLLDMLDR